MINCFNSISVGGVNIISEHPFLRSFSNLECLLLEIKINGKLLFLLFSLKISNIYFFSLVSVIFSVSSKINAIFLFLFSLKFIFEYI